MKPLVAGVVCLLLFATASAEEKPLDAAWQAKWRAAIVPAEPERAWRRVGWRATLWSAVVEAHAQEKPILLWAMNGHPLACT